MGSYDRQENLQIDQRGKIRKDMLQWLIMSRAVGRRTVVMK